MLRRTFMTGLLAAPAIVAAPNIWVPPRRVLIPLRIEHSYIEHDVLGDSYTFSAYVKTREKKVRLRFGEETAVIDLKVPDGIPIDRGDFWRISMDVPDFHPGTEYKYGAEVIRT